MGGKKFPFEALNVVIFYHYCRFNDAAFQVNQETGNDGKAD